jgi:hypothetical protein
MTPGCGDSDGKKETEFHTAGGFFLLMGVGAALEHVYKKVSKRHVGGLRGWVWTRWTISWGTLMIGAAARRGLMENL